MPFLRMGSLLTKARYFDDQLEPGEVCLEHPIAPHKLASSPRSAYKRSYQNQRLVDLGSLKNGYPFDLSKVCHLVDIPHYLKNQMCLSKHYSDVYFGH